MPSKQIREFQKADGTLSTAVSRSDLVLYQESTSPFTNYGIELDDVYKSFGYEYIYTTNGANEDQSITLKTLSGISSASGTGGYVKVLQQVANKPVSLLLYSNLGNTDGGNWNFRGEATAQSGDAGTLKIQNNVGAEWTDIVTIKSHGSASANQNQSSLEVKDRIAATGLNVDSGNIRYEPSTTGGFTNPSGGVETLQLDHNIDLLMYGGQGAGEEEADPSKYVRWDSSADTLKFEGTAISTADPNPDTTHILMHAGSKIGLGGDNSDDDEAGSGNYLTAGKTDSGDDMKVTGLLFSGWKGWGTNQQLDFEIKNRDQSDGGASLTLTADDGTAAGDSGEIRYGAISNGSASSGVMAFGLYTDHASLGTPSEPVLLGRFNATADTAEVSVHGHFHVKDEIRFHDSGVSAPGHMIGGRNGTNKYAGFKAPATVTADHTYTLPADLPDADKVLQSTDGGVLSWVTLPTSGTGTVNEGDQYKVAYYPNAGSNTVVDDTSALYWKNDRLGVNEGNPQTDVHLKSTAGPTVRLERQGGAIDNGDELGVIEFYGFDDGSTDLEGVGAKIVGEASGGWVHDTNENDTQAELQFWTTPGGDDTGLSKRLTIKDSGVIKHEKATHTNINSLSLDGNAVALDLDDSDLHKVTLTANVTTLNLNNPKVGQRFIIRVLQDSTGGRTVSWPSSIKWAGGSAPSISTAADKATTLGFLTVVAGGSPEFDGFLIGKDIA